jgi:hypothetical protein
VGEGGSGFLISLAFGLVTLGLLNLLDGKQEIHSQVCMQIN